MPIFQCGHRRGPCCQCLQQLLAQLADASSRLRHGRDARIGQAQGCRAGFRQHRSAPQNDRQGGFENLARRMLVIARRPHQVGHEVRIQQRRFIKHRDQRFQLLGRHVARRRQLQHHTGDFAPGKRHPHATTHLRRGQRVIEHVVEQAGQRNRNRHTDKAWHAGNVESGERRVYPRLLRPVRIPAAACRGNEPRPLARTFSPGSENRQASRWSCGGFSLIHNLCG